MRKRSGAPPRCVELSLSSHLAGLGEILLRYCLRCQKQVLLGATDLELYLQFLKKPLWVLEENGTVKELLGVPNVPVSTGRTEREL